MDTHSPTDATMRAKALARWENEGGAPDDEHGEVAGAQTLRPAAEPQPQAKDPWQ